MKRFFILLLVAVLCLSSLPTLADAPALLYTGTMLKDINLRVTESQEADSLGVLRAGEDVGIIDYSPEWLHLYSERLGEGYVLRQYVDAITPLDPENTPPYGAILHSQVATVCMQTPVYAAPDAAAEELCTVTPGSRISFWYIQDGWIVIPYQRKIGYIPASAISDLEPVAPTAEYAQRGDILAAFTSFYKTTQTELNLGRMVNIDVACDYISIVMNPGDEFSFNDIAGPYRAARGYMSAPVLIDGTTMPGYGGGTCQVSTTLYNVLLQLWKGITIIHRRPHGPSGASYVPHGVDAAVGSENLDLIFQNAYDFPIQIDASAQDGALFIAIRKA